MSSLATQKRYPRSKHGAHQCAYESSSDAVSPALHTHHPTGREALAKGMDQVVSSPPPAPGALLERATDESLLHPGNSTTASTLIYGAALNAAFLALAVVAFVGLRHSAARAPLVSKLFTPRQLVAQVEALEDAEYDGTPREGGVDPVVSRARAMKVLNRDVAATTLPPLPASLAWVLSLFRVTDSQVVVYAGMDGVAFLRFFQACALLFGVAALVVPLLLCPLYEAGGGSLALPFPRPAPGPIFSLATGFHPSWRLLMWAPVVVAVPLFIGLAALLRQAQRDLLHLRLHVSTQVGGGSDSPQSFSVLVTDIPAKHRTPEEVQKFFQRLFPDVPQQHGQQWPLVVPAPVTDTVEPAWEKRNAAAARLAAVVADAGISDTVSAAASAMAEARSLDISVQRAAHWSTKYDVHLAHTALVRAQRELDMARREAMTLRSGAAIVVFPTRVSAVAAGGGGHGHLLTAAGAANNGGRWHAQGAPPPDAVDWYAVQLSPRSRTVRRAFAISLCAAVVLGFLFVVAAVSSLVSLQSLATVFPSALGSLAASKGAPVIDGYLAVLALLTCLFVAPPALRAACRHSRGYITVGDADAAAARAFLWLYLVDVFLGAAAIQALLREAHAVLGASSTQTGSGGSTTTQSVTLVDVAHALGGTVLGAAPFFLLIAMARAGTGMGAVLLRVSDTPLVMWRLLTSRTVRSERAAWAPLVPPLVIDWVPTSVFVLFLGLVYVPVCPLMAFPVAIFFGAGSIVYRLQLLYVYAPRGSGFGQDASLWVHLRDAILDAVLVALAVLTSVLAVHRALGPTLAAGALLIWAIFTAHSVRNDDAGAAFMHMPRDVAASADARTGPLRSEMLPYPLPEAVLPKCMYDDSDTLPDPAFGPRTEELYRRAAALGAPPERFRRWVPTPPEPDAPRPDAPPPPPPPPHAPPAPNVVVVRRVVVPGAGGYTPGAVAQVQSVQERAPLVTGPGAGYGAAGDNNQWPQ